MIDFLLLVLLALAGYLGWLTGLVRQVVSFAGFCIALLVAWFCYESFGDALLGWTGMDKWTINAISFVLIALTLTILLAWVAALLTKTIDTFHLGVLNRTTGIVISVFKYALLLGCIIDILVFADTISQASLNSTWLAKPLANMASAIFGWAVGA